MPLVTFAPSLIVCMEFSLEPIGIIHSCFKEKFGIPRQPGLAPAARAQLELFPPYGSHESLRGLSAFSHLWIIFIFHANPQNAWKATVRPPRLGGNRHIGVFASRSGFRPNRLGMSAVKLEQICSDASGVRLHLSGVDLLNGTPVLDIKPYLPYADSLPTASAGFAAEKPFPIFSVEFSPEADVMCRHLEKEWPLFRQLIVQILQSDPRPAYYGGETSDRTHGVCIHDVDVKWKQEKHRIIVTAVEPILPVVD